MFTKVLAKSPTKAAGERLYAAAAARGRDERLYRDFGAPDTVEGRFELLTLHIILLVDRLKGEAGDAARIRQTLFDAYVSNLDGALREMGVGDLAVGKRMRRLGEAFYGRAHACDAAFAALPDLQELLDMLGRTVFAGGDGDRAGLAGYILAVRASLARQEVGTLIHSGPDWGAP